MDKKSHYRVIILGSGAAGLTAAIYAARANLQPLVIEGSQPGGQLTITTDVENYPGFPKGIMGPELMEEFKKQAVRFGTEMLFGDVNSVNLAQRPFQLTVDKEAYTCDTLIVATGATAKLLGLESEKKLMGYGVSACATCDGFFFKEKELVVVGGGDTAMEEATFLTKFATRVSVVHRRDKLRASKIMQERAEKNPKISFIWDSAVEEVYGDPKAGGVKGVKLKNLKTGKIEDFKTDGFSSPSVMSRIQSFSPASSNWIRTATFTLMMAPRPISRVFSLAATCRIISTARLLQRRARDVWRRSMRRDFWRVNPTRVALQISASTRLLITSGQCRCIQRAARPKTDGLAASDAFQFAKFYNVAERESSIRVGVSPAKQLGVKHRAVVKIDVG